MKYKITIEEITEEEYPETSYENTHKKDDDGKEIYKYIETGRKKTERKCKEIYTQEIEDLNLNELATFINKAK